MLRALGLEQSKRGPDKGGFVLYTCAGLVVDAPLAFPALGPTNPTTNMKDLNETQQNKVKERTNICVLSKKRKILQAKKGLRLAEGVS